MPRWLARKPSACKIRQVRHRAGSAAAERKRASRRRSSVSYVKFTISRLAHFPHVLYNFMRDELCPGGSKFVLWEGRHARRLLCADASDRPGPCRADRAPRAGAGADRRAAARGQADAGRKAESARARGAHHRRRAQGQRAGRAFCRWNGAHPRGRCHPPDGAALQPRAQGADQARNGAEQAFGRAQGLHRRGRRGPGPPCAA